MLGQRDPKIYGTETLDDIKKLCQKTAEKNDHTIDFRQSNHEGELVSWIQEEKDNINGLVINAAAYTHTSLAIYDALELVSVPIIEVHMSNPKERETFRHFSYVELAAKKTFSGMGGQSYVKAVEYLSINS